MNILIIGCGRVGSHLVRTLEDLGHDVSVLEGDEKNVDRLLSMENHEFGGMVQIGSPIDEDMLRQAGIENCDAVAAVCPEDNINLMVCQIASEIFHVPRVLARVADPVRKKIFAERFGMHIICSTNLTVEAILRGVLTGSEGPAPSTSPPPNPTPLCWVSPFLRWRFPPARAFWAFSGPTARWSSTRCPVP